MSLQSYNDDIDFPDSSNNKKPAASIIARSVKDPIHDLISLSHRLSMFIDTKQFQRLRNIKQLGTSYYVWLGASHNRFEHCIGVAFLARSMASHLQKSQPELGITERDIECVEIAGLCHDLGHGPWSHVWDELFIPKALPDKKWKHEDGSVMMFDYMVHDNEIPLAPKDDSFIKALISGRPERCSPDEKPFLFDIVANRRNGLDVDKFDYILRDSHMIGDKMSIALPRIIKSARVLDNQICYDIKDANQIYEICAMRFKLHKIVYNHKAAKAIEYMIIDALLAAEPHLHIAERVFVPEKYLHLTDNIMPQIEASTDPELALARAIFERVRNRDLYKMVDYKVVDWLYREEFAKFITPERIAAAAKALPATGDISAVNTAALKAEDIICDFSFMHYGMKEKNPLDFVKFYSKRNPNESANAERGDYSNLMPEYHAEMLVRIFTKNVDYFGIIQAGYRTCLATIPAKGLPSTPPPIHPEVSQRVSTPPAPDVPSTPRALSRNPSLTFITSTSGGLIGSTITTPFSNNSFTTVSPSFVPISPLKGNRRSKRLRDSDIDHNTPGKKTRSG